jgi:hypothetical protein
MDNTPPVPTSNALPVTPPPVDDVKPPARPLPAQPQQQPETKRPPVESKAPSGTNAAITATVIIVVVIAILIVYAYIKTK